MKLQNSRIIEFYINAGPAKLETVAFFGQLKRRNPDARHPNIESTALSEGRSIKKNTTEFEKAQITRIRNCKRHLLTLHDVRLRRKHFLTK